MNGPAIRDYVTGDAICFVRCGAQCEAFYSWAHSGRNESLPNHKVTSTTSCVFEGDGFEGLAEMTFKVDLSMESKMYGFP